MLLLFLWATPCRAQYKKVEITVFSVEKDEATGRKKAGIPLKEAQVWGFYDTKKAKNFLANFKDLGFTPQQNHGDIYTQTDDEGIAYLELPLNSGVVVVRSSFGEPRLEPVKNRMSIRVEIFNDMGRLMDEVTSRASYTRRNKPRPGRRVGNKKFCGPYPFYLFEKDTRSNARFGLSPIVTILESYDSIRGTIDTFQVVRPFLKDGKAYHRSQERRMLYDMKHDPLSPYLSEQLMDTRKDDSVMVRFLLYPIERNKHYKVDATTWFEDYNMVYASDSVCLDEGYDEEPMRFLEFDVVSASIDSTRYVRRGKREPVDDTRELHLNFLLGKALLDPNDSTNFEQLHMLEADMGRYVYDKDASVVSVKIHGKASPEGGIATNERLCIQRADYLRSELLRTYPELRGVCDVSGSVASWGEVADLLEQDSLTEEALQVREIVEKTRDARAQEGQIRRLGCYEYIKENVLPRLRVDEVTFSYVAQRIRSREEIYQLYDTDSAYRDGSKEKDYEFCVLFERFKDNPKALEPLAAAAYRSIKDVRMNRPWPLAAYYLAQCYLKRDYVDTVMLKPFLDWRFGIPNYEQRDVNEVSVGWFNDEAIVSTHIAMLCKAGDYTMADSVAVNLLPDDAKFAKLRLFLDCLNEGWNEPRVREAVAATSSMNHAVVYAAQDAPGANNRYYHEQALAVLQDSTRLSPLDPRVKYMEAILRFRLEAPREAKLYGEENFLLPKPKTDEPLSAEEEESRRLMALYGYEEEEEASDTPKAGWGVPMVECMLLDENYKKILKYDGYFNKAYRKAFDAYWRKLKADPKEDTLERE